MAALAASRGWVQLTTVGGDILAARTNGSVHVSAKPAVPPGQTALRDRIEASLKLSLPAHAVRQRIYSAAAEVLSAFEGDEAAIPLVDLQDSQDLLHEQVRQVRQEIEEITWHTIP